MRGHLIRTVTNAVVWLSIWVVGCAIADYIIPEWVGRCWIMLFGVATYEVQKACTSVTRVTGHDA